MKVWRPLLLFVVLSACNDHGPSALPEDKAMPPAPPDSATFIDRLSKPPENNEQISQYIRRIFQDRDGNMWFGTTSDGVCRYDPSASLSTSGRSLTYFTTADGLGGNWVSAMAQDAQGNLWFATGGGVSRFDPSATLSAGGTKFTTFTTKEGLAGNQVWSLLIDKNGSLWAGTEEGVSRFTGKSFIPFPIPAADFSKFPYYENPKQINSIIEDKSGNIWFATNGGGVYRYNPSAPRSTPSELLSASGKALTNLSEKDGLCNNFVQAILEDRAGNLWFGTRHGGLCKYDGTTFTAYGRDALKGDDIWALYQDSGGIIWIAMTRVGLCSYDGTTFTCYGEQDGVGIRVVQCLLEDANGQLWVGTSGGVYRFDGGKFINWTKEDARRPD